jgi:hypothetical protein
VPPRSGILQERGAVPTVRDGLLRLTDAPGFGVTIDEGWLQAL